MWNLIIGLVFVIGGLTGKLALLGTDSSTALAVFGAVLIVLGLSQIRSRKKTVNEAMRGFDDV